MRKVLGRNLQRLRKSQGWTQEELGQRLGITRYQVRRLEKGTSGTSIDNLQKIAEVFRVPWAALLIDDGDTVVTLRNLPLNRIRLIDDILKTMPPEMLERVATDGRLREILEVMAQMSMRAYSQNLTAEDLEPVLGAVLDFVERSRKAREREEQVLIEELSKARYAVVVIDVEGEYTNMDSPSTEEHLYQTLSTFGLGPAGIDDFHVYCPCASESEREDATHFSLRVADIEPTILSELIEPSEAQERRLLDVIDELAKKAKKEQNKAKGPGLSSLMPSPSQTSVFYTLDILIDTVKNKGDNATGADRNSYFALFGKLNRLRRTKVFDVPDAPTIDASELLQSGRVSVFDVSYCSDVIKNLVIADVLRKVIDYKIEHSDSARTLVVVEEAHSFISREKRGRMMETLEMLREIARRGRKRWLGLAFVSQQPSHLPPEIFELCNTRIVHNVKGEENLRSLRVTAGDVSEEMWGMVPTLGTGQAVLTTPQLRDPNPVMPAPSRPERAQPRAVTPAPRPVTTQLVVVGFTVHAPP
ncbi:MAG: helix-turn-helix domain-containing protein [Pigmentiphaga sp.]